jgi:DtxR family Mn-dependent transcriptional regulator
MTPGLPRLSRSREDYLKAMLALDDGAHPVTMGELARRLGVRAPSVTNMLGTLARDQLVAYVPRAGARLTPAGRRQALALIRRHRILETFLVRILGFDWSEVHEDAEVLEHHVSDRVLDALDRLVGHPAEDPHGHAIPDRRGRMPRRNLAALATLARGQRATVREIRDRDRRRMARWKEAGLVPGARVRVRDVRPLEDVFELEVGGRRMVTGSEGLDGILVQIQGGSRRG